MADLQSGSAGYPLPTAFVSSTYQSIMILAANEFGFIKQENRRGWQPAPSLERRQRLPPPDPPGAQMRPNGRRFHSRLIGGFLTPLGMFNTVEREEGGGAASRDSIAPPPCLLRLCLCRLIDFDSFFSVTATAVLLLASRLPPPTSPLPLPLPPIFSLSLPLFFFSEHFLGGS